MAEEKSQEEKAPTLTAEEQEEILGYIGEANRRHVKHVGPAFGSWWCNEIDTDIYLQPWEKVLHAGSYFHPLPQTPITAEELGGESFDLLYSLSIDRDSLAEALGNAKDEGRLTVTEEEDGSLVTRATSDNAQLRATIKPVEVAEGRYVTLSEAMTWAAIADAQADGDADKAQRIFTLAYRANGAKEEEIPEITLAQYSKDRSFQNHDYGARAVDGLFAIAMGQESYELTPRHGSGSHERYVLTGSEEKCTKLFELKGANGELVRAVMDTVKSLRDNPHAAEFVDGGRVWFSVNHIAKELMRTRGGSVRSKDNATAHELVDRALEAASGAQITGTRPDGTTSTVMYLLDAVRLPKITYKGTVYRDVWGFSVNAETLAEHAQGKAHTWNYAIPDRKKPFTLDSAVVHSYLSNILHEARGKLYYTPKRDGKPSGQLRKKTKTNTVTLKRSWGSGDKSIFALYSPARELDSRQKARLVKAFEAELTQLVYEEAHGMRHEGAPMYVRAWSERDGGRGRGKGAYLNLVLECSTTFRAVRDGRNGHGSIDLQNGVEKAAPEK